MSKKQVLVVRPNIPEKALSLLRERYDVEVISSDVTNHRSWLLSHAAGKDALLVTTVERIDKELLDAAGPNLKVVATVSVGLDHIDLEECRKRNIKVGYTPNILTDAVADFAVGLLLAACRRILEGVMEIKRDVWSKETWNYRWMNGVDIRNKTIGIVGLGRIGSAVIERLRPFKVKKFLYFDAERKSYDQALGAQFATFDEMLQNSDVIIVCCSLTESTRKLFNRESFQKMKKSSVFVNVGRGEVVDHDALYEALTSERIFAAGIDVTHPEPLPMDHPLHSLNNCIITPHIASSGTDTRLEMAIMTCQNIIGALEGKEMPARVC